MQAKTIRTCPNPYASQIRLKVYSKPVKILRIDTYIHNTFNIYIYKAFVTKIVAKPVISLTLIDIRNYRKHK